MIRFDHITKKYAGTTRPALNAIDLEVLRGEFVFLVGASGSGKSSCLRLILKEEKPSSGSIHVLGQDLRSISNRKVPYFRRNLGVVFQDFRLLPNKTVYQNVAFSLQVIGKSRGFIQEAVPDTLKMVGLAEKAQRLPHELSGGEQQRVAIARAIVNKPQILLADEPTGNLDPTTSAGIMALLASINAGGTTVIMATHEAGIVDRMQRRVIELASGEILRDERQGGYGATAAIAIPTQAAAAMRGAPATPSAPAVPAAAAAATAPNAHTAPVGTRDPISVTTAPNQTVASPHTPSQPLTFPPAPPRREAPPVAATAKDTGMPVPHVEAETESEDVQDDAAATATIAKPVPSVTQHDAPEQLTLAEKLGLRAPGEKPDPTTEQNVGPTK